MGVDLVETNEGLKVIEINVGAEFHGLSETTDTDIAGEILDYLVRKVATLAERREAAVAGTRLKMRASSPQRRRDAENGRGKSKE